MLNLDTLYSMFIRVGWGNLVVSVVAFVVSVMITSVFMAVSVLIGAAISIINLSVMARSVKNSFLLKSDKAQQFVIQRYYIRFIATLFIIALLVSKKLVSPIGLIVGFSIIMITTLSTTIYFAKKELI